MQRRFAQDYIFSSSFAVERAGGRNREQTSEVKQVRVWTVLFLESFCLSTALIYITHLSIS
jgi:hypothetical protein